MLTQPYYCCFSNFCFSILHSMKNATIISLLSTHSLSLSCVHQTTLSLIVSINIIIIIINHQNILTTHQIHLIFISSPPNAPWYTCMCITCKPPSYLLMLKNCWNTNTVLVMHHSPILIVVPNIFISSSNNNSN